MNEKNASLHYETHSDIKDDRLALSTKDRAFLVLD